MFIGLATVTNVLSNPRQFLSLCRRQWQCSGRSRTLDLGIMRQVFDHCASATALTYFGTFKIALD
jgi:hypothetical protein